MMMNAPDSQSSSVLTEDIPAEITSLLQSHANDKGGDGDGDGDEGDCDETLSSTHSSSFSSITSTSTSAAAVAVAVGAVNNNKSGNGSNLHLLLHRKNIHLDKKKKMNNNNNNNLHMVRHRAAAPSILQPSHHLSSKGKILTTRKSRSSTKHAKYRFSRLCDKDGRLLCLVRIFLVSLLLAWLVAMILVARTIPATHEMDQNAGRARWTLLGGRWESKHTSKLTSKATSKLTSKVTSKVTSKGGSADLPASDIKADIPTQGNPVNHASNGGVRGRRETPEQMSHQKSHHEKLPTLKEAGRDPTKPDLTFPNQQSKDTPNSFNNIPPFQHSTPHAPSCSAPLTSSNVTFTLVTQLSDDRVWMVHHHCRRWGPHPISMVIFTNEDAPSLRQKLLSEGCYDQHLTLQTLPKSLYDTTEYPVNVLRNLALSAVRTSHVVYADVDFWPSSDLHDILSMPSVQSELAYDAKLATVLPAFQMNRRCREYRDCKSKNIPSMPETKDVLLEMWKKQEASTFDPTNGGGHGSTKYQTWITQEVGDFVDLTCIRSNRYEPYLVVRYCRDLPPFQEAFTGYGKNKMTWAMQLRRTGYLFSQLGGAFLVHYPHLDSPSRLEWNKKPEALEQNRLSVNELLESSSSQQIDWNAYKRARVDALFLKFREWMEEEVEDVSRVPMCKDAQNDDYKLWVHAKKGKKDDNDGEDDDDEEDDDDDEEDAK